MPFYGYDDFGRMMHAIDKEAKAEETAARLERIERKLLEAESVQPVIEEIDETPQPPEDPLEKLEYYGISLNDPKLAEIMSTWRGGHMTRDELEWELDDFVQEKVQQKAKAQKRARAEDGRFAPAREARTEQPEQIDVSVIEDARTLYDLAFKDIRKANREALKRK